MPSGTIPIAQLPHNMEENCGKRSIKTREWVQGAAPKIAWVSTSWIVKGTAPIR